MSKARPPKKTETLEVRVPYALKRDFMAQARSRGRTASAELREFIDSYLADGRPVERRPRFNRLMSKRMAKPAAATAMIGAIVAAHLMLPTAAAAASDFRSAFAQLDRNKDGRLTPDELSAEPVHEADALHSLDNGRVANGVVPDPAAAHKIQRRARSPLAMPG
jgi:hypothetical protein